MLEPPRVLATVAARRGHVISSFDSILTGASASAATASPQPRSTAHGSTGYRYAVLSPTLKTLAVRHAKKHKGPLPATALDPWPLCDRAAPNRNACGVSARQIRNAGIIAETAALAKRPLP